MSTEKKRGRGRPPVDSEMLRFRAARDVVAGVDSFAHTQQDKPQRSEAVRRIVTEWLRQHGYLPPS